MRKILLLFFILTIIQACSSSESVLESNNSPDFVAPIYGRLKINVMGIALHPGESTTVFANQYNQNGVLINSPSLNWSSTDTAVASVNNGIVTANGEGYCEIVVQDGIREQRMSVNVINNIFEIGNNPTQISFDDDLLVLWANDSKPLPHYQLYNAKGQPVSGYEITILPPQDASLTFSSNNISSARVMGRSDALVRVGNDTLQNGLGILVASQVDTTYAIKLAPYTFPGKFYKDGVAANRPVKIEVTKNWFNNGQLQQQIYTTSPDRIELNDDCVTLDTNGRLKSIKRSTNKYYHNDSHGYMAWSGCKAKISYKDQYIFRGTTVAVNITGIWNCILGNGDSYSYCLTQKGIDVGYTIDNLYSYNPGPTHTFSGTYLIQKDEEPFSYGLGNYCGGTYKAMALTDFPSPLASVSLRHEGESVAVEHHYAITQNGDELLTRYNNSWEPVLNLKRDSSVCESEGTNSLQAVLSGHSWTPNSCMRQKPLSYSSPIIFYSNGTWSMPNGLYNNQPWLENEGPVTWSVINNQIIRMVFRRYIDRDNLTLGTMIDEETWNVDGYTESSVSLVDGAVDCTMILER
ncbi:MAG: hypothetical protein U0X58_05415 [Flavobacteriaceae bacterium]